MPVKWYNWNNWTGLNRSQLNLKCKLTLCTYQVLNCKCQLSLNSHLNLINICKMQSWLLKKNPICEMTNCNKSAAPLL